MQEKGRKQSKKQKESSASANPDLKNLRKANKPPKTAGKRKRQTEPERKLTEEEIVVSRTDFRKCRPSCRVLMEKWATSNW